MNPPLASADWRPIIECEGSRMVVDQNTHYIDPQNQLVIRNSPETLRYFSSKTDITRALNERNELVVNVMPGGPSIEGYPSILFVGFIGGKINLIVSQVSNEVYKVALWEVSHRGAHSEEVANWDFRGCRRL